jgi:phosphatidylglycerophosphate synthase
MDSYQIGDRRPLASRGWKISEKIARWLAGHGATPNAISIVGMVCVQLRLLANLYDGMVAVLRETASPVGELFNEVPDRVSDAATLIGFGYATGSDPVLGFVATIFAIFLAYLRAQGKVAGAHQEFCGPMAKQQRMATVTFVALICAIVPSASDWRIPMFALWLIIAGCVITVVRRWQRITATLRRR